MNTYILQKDTPNSKTGEEFTFKENDCNNRGAGYYGQHGMYWHPVIVENNPDWFKLKEEPKCQFKAVVIIPATETKPEGKYFDMSAIRSLHSVMRFMGFDYLTLNDLVSFVMQKPINTNKIDALSLIKLLKLWLVKTQKFDIAATLRDLEKEIESCNKDK